MPRTKKQSKVSSPSPHEEEGQVSASAPDTQADATLTQDEQAYATLQARKLALFIGTMNVPDDIKRDLFIIAENMDLETLERLISWMEGNYVAQNLKFLDTAFEREVQAVSRKYDQKKERLADKTVADIKALTEKVKRRALTSQLANVTA